MDSDGELGAVDVNRAHCGPSNCDRCARPLGATATQIRLPDGAWHGRHAFEETNSHVVISSVSLM